MIKRTLTAIALSTVLVSGMVYADGVWDKIEGNWTQFKGQVQETWGELTDDEMDQIEGKRDQLVGIIQEKYGLAKEAAEQQVDEWAEKIGS